MIADVVVWTVGLSVVWVVANWLGWLTSFYRDGDPFNWRVWLGPWAYSAWVDRRAAAELEWRWERTESGGWYSGPPR